MEHPDISPWGLSSMCTSRSFQLFQSHAKCKRCAKSRLGAWTTQRMPCACHCRTLVERFQSRKRSFKSFLVSRSGILDEHGETCSIPTFLRRPEFSADQGARDGDSDNIPRVRPVRGCLKTCDSGPGRRNTCGKRGCNFQVPGNPRRSKRPCLSQEPVRCVEETISSEPVIPMSVPTHLNGIESKVSPVCMCMSEDTGFDLVHRYGARERGALRNPSVHPISIPGTPSSPVHQKRDVNGLLPTATHDDRTSILRSRAQALVASHENTYGTPRLGLDGIPSPLGISSTSDPVANPLEGFCKILNANSPSKKFVVPQTEAKVPHARTLSEKELDAPLVVVGRHDVQLANAIPVEVSSKPALTSMDSMASAAERVSQPPYERRDVISGASATKNGVDPSLCKEPEISVFRKITAVHPKPRPPLDPSRPLVSGAYDLHVVVQTPALSLEGKVDAATNTSLFTNGHGVPLDMTTRVEAGTTSAGVASSALMFTNGHGAPVAARAPALPLEDRVGAAPGPSLFTNGHGVPLDMTTRVEAGTTSAGVASSALMFTNGHGAPVAARAPALPLEDRVGAAPGPSLFTNGHGVPLDMTTRVEAGTTSAGVASSALMFTNGHGAPVAARAPALPLEDRVGAAPGPSLFTNGHGVPLDMTTRVEAGTTSAGVASSALMFTNGHGAPVAARAPALPLEDRVGAAPGPSLFTNGHGVPLDMTTRVEAGTTSAGVASSALMFTNGHGAPVAARAPALPLEDRVGAAPGPSLFTNGHGVPVDAKKFCNASFAGSKLGAATQLRTNDRGSPIGLRTPLMPLNPNVMVCPTSSPSSSGYGPPTLSNLGIPAKMTNLAVGTWMATPCKPASPSKLLFNGSGGRLHPPEARPFAFTTPCSTTPCTTSPASRRRQSRSTDLPDQNCKPPGNVQNTMQTPVFARRPPRLSFTTPPYDLASVLRTRGRLFRTPGKSAPPEMLTTPRKQLGTISHIVSTVPKDEEKNTPLIHDKTDSVAGDHEQLLGRRLQMSSKRSRRNSIGNGKQFKMPRRVVPPRERTSAPPVVKSLLFEDSYPLLLTNGRLRSPHTVPVSKSLPWSYPLSRAFIPACSLSWLYDIVWASNGLACCMNYRFCADQLGNKDVLDHAVRRSSIDKLGADGCFGAEECVSWVALAFKNMEGKGATTVGSPAWVRMSYAIAVWKYARLALLAMQHGRDECEGMMFFSASHVVRDLMRRINTEWTESRVPPLLQILRRDASSVSHLALIVLQVSSPREGAVELHVSDGWYVARASVDAGLALIVSKTKRLDVCDKVQISHFSVSECKSERFCFGNGDELDSNILKLCTNSTRKVQSSQSERVSLGFRPNRLQIALASVYPFGGTVPSVVGRICRSYPLVFVERRDGQPDMVRNQEAEALAQDTFLENARQYVEAGRLRQSRSENLTMEEQVETPSRDVSRRIEFLIDGLGHGRCDSRSHWSMASPKWLVTIWNPSEDVCDLVKKEGAVVVLLGAKPACRRDQFTLRVDSGCVFPTGEEFQNVGVRSSSRNLRVAHYGEDLFSGRVQRGEEFDGVFVVVHVGELSARPFRRHIFLADSLSGVHVLAMQLTGEDARVLPRVFANFVQNQSRRGKLSGKQSRRFKKVPCIVGLRNAVFNGITEETEVADVCYTSRTEVLPRQAMGLPSHPNPARAERAPARKISSQYSYFRTPAEAVDREMNGKGAEEQLNLLGDAAEALVNGDKTSLRAWFCLSQTQTAVSPAL